MDLTTKTRRRRSVLTTVHQWICGWTGHETIHRFTTGRQYLTCLKCDHESHGWQITERPSTHQSVPMHHDRAGRINRLGTDTRSKLLNRSTVLTTSV
jgi:hypothetical protein